MQSIKIVIDSTCDLTPELFKRCGIAAIVPLSVIMGDKQFKDENFDSRNIYQYVKENRKLPKTSAVNEYDFHEAFERLTADGSAVLCFTISADLSATHASAVAAAKRLKDVYVVDARQLSSGSSLLIMRGLDMLAENPSLTAKELAETLNAMGRAGKVQSSFVVDVIDYLYRGGRCSALALLGANVLKLHPSLHLKEGLITVGKKYRGKMTKIFAKYIADLKEENPNYDDTRCFITYTADTDPEVIAEAERAVREHFNFKEILFTTAGATITCHCGRGTLGLLFMRK